MSLILMITCLVAASDSSLTVEELDAAFLQNAYQAKTLRVEWAMVTRRSKAEWEYARLACEYGARELKAGRIPEGVAPSQLESYKAMVKQKLAEPEPKPESLTLVDVEDYWTDRVRYQQRFPAVGDRRSWPPKTKFPDEFTTVKSLPERFRGFTIVSGGLKDGRWRYWVGGEDGMGQGRVSSSSPRKVAVVLQFPPLAIPDRSWGHGFHWIDFFFQAHPLVVRHEGSMTLDGVRVEVVTKSHPTMNDPVGKGSTVIRAFLDPARAAMPVRMEIFFRESANETSLDWLPPGTVCDFSGKPLPSEIVRDIKTEIRQGEMHYPVSGVIERPASKPGTHLSKEPVFIVGESSEWSISKLEINREIPAEMFDFEFPSGTPFVDETTGGDLWVSHPDGFAERVSAGWARMAKRSNRHAYWWVGGFVIGVVVVGWSAMKLWRSRSR